MAHYIKGAKVSVTVNGIAHEGEIERVIDRPKGAGAVHNPYLPNGGMQTYRVFLPEANQGIGQLVTVPETHVHPPRELSRRTFNTGDRVIVDGTEYTVTGLDKEREDGTRVYALQADGFENADPRDFPWERGAKLAGAGAMIPVIATPDLIPDDIMDAPDTKPDLAADSDQDLGWWARLDPDDPEAGLGL